MVKTSFYDEAHVIASAIRVLEFRNGSSPSPLAISEHLGMGLDKVSMLCSKLSELGIVNMVAGPFQATTVILTNHLDIEKIPKEVRENRMEDEIKKIREKSQNAYEAKVKAATQGVKKREKELFDALQKKLKEEMGKS